jgi:hypothetical protein
VGIFVACVLGVLALLGYAGWTAGGVLTVDGQPISVHSVNCQWYIFGPDYPGMSVDVTSTEGWPGTIRIAQKTYRGNVNTAHPSVSYSIAWDIFRSMTWTDAGPGSVTYWHGYLNATLTGGHRLVGLLRCPDAPST